MKLLEAEDREVIPSYNLADVDPEFLPYLERINAKPFVASIECCIGHCPFDQVTHKREFNPRTKLYNVRKKSKGARKGRWGYLQLLMTCPSALWLCQEVSKSQWLRVDLSKMWPKWSHIRPGDMPEYTDFGNFIIALAWDASSWPTPAEDICALLDQYHEAEPDEPLEVLDFSRHI